MFKKILVAIDHTAAAQRALATAIPMANLFQAELQIVNVVGEDVDSPTDALTLLGQARAQVPAPLLVDTRVLAADPFYGVHGIAEAIIAAVGEWQADLVVVGTGNRHGLERFLVGAVEDDLVATVSASILIVQAPGNSSD